MIAKLNRQMWILWILMSTGLISGCDDRATQIAREAANRQAQQNTAMAELNKEVASGTHKLVEADAKARQEIVGVHRDLQAERTRLDTGWGALESERRQIAGQRRTESMFESMTQFTGGLLLLATLLGFCWYALAVARRGDDTHAQLNELLIGEILSDELPILSSNQRSPPLLGKPDSREGLG